MTAAHAHPLDRPVWSALTTRQAALAEGGTRALRFRPDHALFAAAADSAPDSLAALAALVAPGECIGLVKPDPPPAPPGLMLVSSAPCWQMIAPRITVGETGDDIEPLTVADAPEMRALVDLTRPGPFFARTHEMGVFVGIRRDGRLIAMAGTRMALPGFVEVSGVCTHPDGRGEGLASRLIRHVDRAILASGDVPVLHTYADNDAANRLYEGLGFAWRQTVDFSLFTRC